MKNKKYLLVWLLIALLTLTACAGKQEPAELPAQDNTRTVVDGAGREVELPERVERIVCVGVGALRYTCYMDAQDLVVGVEDCEQVATMTRLYNYVNFEQFAALPITGENGVPYVENIIDVDPQVIILSAFAAVDPDELTAKTGIPVVVVPGSDTTMDEKAYETIRIMGEVYGMEDRAEELTGYLDGLKADLEKRIAAVPEGERPTVYVGGVSFKGHHGFEGTEAGYGPLALIGANNLADTTGQAGAFNIDLEQVLEWDPDVIFVDFNGLPIINEDYAVNPDYYESLTAVQEGRVYAQISFRSNATNLETALADTYYAATVLYPEQFADVDIREKTGEIFTMLLGSDPYNDLKEAGYAFRPIQIGE